MKPTETLNLPGAGCAEMRGGGLHLFINPAPGLFAYSKYEGLNSQGTGGSSAATVLLGRVHRRTGPQVPGEISALEKCFAEDRHQIGYQGDCKLLESDPSPFSSFYPLSPMGRAVSKSGGSPGT